jgi:hypothetical protein
MADARLKRAQVRFPPPPFPAVRDFGLEDP